MEFVSVHFPKAGGSSLQQSLITAFGFGTVLLDYADDPAHPCSRYSLDPEGCLRRTRETELPPYLKAAHGHFHPSKYMHLKGVKWITFLRHPVDNLISIYYFWKTQTEGHALWSYFRDENLGLFETARLPSLRYLMSRTYFGGVDMAIFDFIGLHENYADDCRTLSRLLEIPIAESRANVNTYPNYRDEVGELKADSKKMRKLTDILIEDVNFYERIVSNATGRLSA